MLPMDMAIDMAMALAMASAMAIAICRVVGVTRMIEPKIGRKIVKDWIIK